MKKEIMLIGLFCLWWIILTGCSNNESKMQNVKTDSINLEQRLQKAKENSNIIRKKTNLILISFGLKNYYMDNGEYPIPDGAMKIYDEDWNLLWYQGKIWQDVFSKIKVRNEESLINEDYDYSLSADLSTPQLKFTYDTENYIVDWGLFWYDGFFLIKTNDKYSLREIPSLFVSEDVVQDWYILKDNDDKILKTFPDWKRDKVMKFDVTKIKNEEDTDWIILKQVADWLDVDNSYVMDVIKTAVKIWN